MVDRTLHKRINCKTAQNDKETEVLLTKRVKESVFLVPRETDLATPGRESQAAHNSRLLPILFML